MASPPGTAPTFTWGALGIVYVVWGSTYLGIRYVVESIPPFLSGATRFATAAVLLSVILVARHGFSALRVTRREVAGAAAVGVLLLGGGNGLVVLAESPGFAVASGIAALLIATVPLMVVLLRAGLGERPRPATILGVILGLVGLALLVLPAGGVPAAPLLGGILLVGAALSWAAGSVLSGRVALPKNPFVASVWEMLAGAVVLASVGLARGELRGFDLGDVTTSSWLGLAYLVVFGSVIAFTAYAWLLQNASVTLASTYAYVNPVVAVFLGALFVDEPITLRVILGGAVVVAAVAVVVTTERPRRSDQP
jgi:drug/metabolite transporter (DMT)-like permease